jgi:hypothetical protein
MKSTMFITRYNLNSCYLASDQRSVVSFIAPGKDEQYLHTGNYINI